MMSSLHKLQLFPCCPKKDEKTPWTGREPDDKCADVFAPLIFLELPSSSFGSPSEKAKVPYG